MRDRKKNCANESLKGRAKENDILRQRGGNYEPWNGTSACQLSNFTPSEVRQIQGKRPLAFVQNFTGE